MGGGKNLHENEKIHLRSRFELRGGEALSRGRNVGVCGIRETFLLGGIPAVIQLGVAARKRYCRVPTPYGLPGGFERFVGLRRTGILAGKCSRWTVCGEPGGRQLGEWEPGDGRRGGQAAGKGSGKVFQQSRVEDLTTVLERGREAAGETWHLKPSSSRVVARDGKVHTSQRSR